MKKKTQRGPVNPDHDSYIMRSQQENPEAVVRRRQIDPTTCERDYSNDEIEFMNALDTYKRSSGRMFPTCSEILEVIRSLGYSKPMFLPPTDFSDTACRFHSGYETAVIFGGVDSGTSMGDNANENGVAFIKHP